MPAFLLIPKAGHLIGADHPEAVRRSARHEVSRGGLPAIPRPYTGLPDIDLSLHDKTIVVTLCGRIGLGKKKIKFSQVFAGQAVGIKEVHDHIWLVTFMNHDQGYVDLETRVLEPLENPFRSGALRG